MNPALYKDSFKIKDSAAMSFQLILKESMYINWQMPNLNSQIKHKNDQFNT